MEFKNLLNYGVFVVVQRHHTSPEHVIGVTATLDGARTLVLDMAGFTLFVPTPDGDGCNIALVDSSDERAVKAFRWHDDSTCGGRYPSRFGNDDGPPMVAYFQDEETWFYVYWTSFRE